ncbi:hypothetical protein [Flavobacterium psychrophilum]|uniref:hypothetical protein n=1 Tax=Flavobacterium psychrophilum TaxID=96345 RepID=UPI000B7C0E56|nr:hypothetical protein [Flavobacterium psychrophilum]SNA88402.1 conserved exported hypothetical protein [Flavobacterium psychrophilum]
MKKLKYYLTFVLLLQILLCQSQEVDLENFKKINFKITGGINANSVFYSSNSSNSRAPFTYMLSGNLNVSAFSFSMPLSYTITNQGNNLGYSVPFNFNRLSLMPKYKWIKGYIGDVSMSFSPYTLSGHPFRGGGLELSPKGRFKFALMGGQLLKAIEVSESANKVPTFQRMGYGVKVGYLQEKYKLEWIGFYAKDNINSIESNFDEAGIAPKENIVNSLNFSSTLITNVDFNVEYALSMLSEDTRANLRQSNNKLNELFSTRENTSIMKAVKASVNYTIQKTKLGLIYERVDPNYKTLGAMFFSNDLENIGFTISRPFFKEKVSVNSNIGFQRDDLAAQKKQNTKRLVGAINATYQANTKLNFIGSYSNFTTFTNRNLSQFEAINNPNITAADTLNFRQLSQNATLNMNYTFGRKKNHNFNFNYTIAGQANEQGGIIRKGQASTVQNYSATHTINFLPIKMALNTSLNYTLNTVSTMNIAAKGAAISLSKKLLKDKLNNNLGVLFNTTANDGKTNSVLGLKYTANYIVLKKHNFSLGAIQMFKKSPTNDLNELTLNFNYGYNF